MKDFWSNNKKIILGTVGALAVISCAAVLLCVGLSKSREKTSANTLEAISQSTIVMSDLSAGTAKHAKAEEEARIKAEEEARRKAEEEARLKAEEEARLKAEEEARLKAEEEARIKAEEEAKAKAEAEAKAKAEAAALEDTKAPVFLYYRGTPSIKVGNDFDIHRFIGYADDVDRDVDLRVDGTVDTSTVGTYPLTLTLTDDTGKTTVKNMEVHVTDGSGGGGGGGGGGEKDQFTDFIANFKTEETKLGIDVSGYQGDIDFEAIKAAGCEFVYIKLGAYDSGDFYIDSKYKQNMAGVKAAGLMKGIYWYGEESNQKEVEASVKYLMDLLGGEPLDFPIAYDWEDYRNFETHHMNLYDLNMCYEYFEQEVEKYGYTATLYGSKNAQENTWTRPKKGPVWLAHYNYATSYAGSYFMWQQSNTGRIDGIKGDVDLDILFPARLNQ